MQSRTLGRSGLEVSALGLGCMGLSFGLMVPGQHHVRMNMYIAQARKGVFEIEKSLGVVDPKECTRGMK